MATVLSLVTSMYFTPMLFGLGAINLAKNPDGLLAIIGHTGSRSDAPEERASSHRGRREAELHHGEVRPRAASDTQKSSALGRASPSQRPRDASPGASCASRGRRRLRRRRGAARRRHRLDRARSWRCSARTAPASPRCAASRPDSSPARSGRVRSTGIDITATSPYRAVPCRSAPCPRGTRHLPRPHRGGEPAGACSAPALRQKAYDRFPILGERRKQIAGLLSGGEQQMLCLAPALADPPTVLVADEPTLGLAPLAADVVMRASSSCATRHRDPSRRGERQHAMEVADIVAFMELGTFVWMGPRAEADKEILAPPTSAARSANEAHRDVREARRSPVRTTCPGDPNQRGECSVQTQNDMGGPLRRGRDRRGDRGGRAHTVGIGGALGAPASTARR